MSNAVSESLDGFYDCLCHCIDCIESKYPVSTLWNIIDNYYADEDITDTQYKILRDVILEITHTN